MTKTHSNKQWKLIPGLAAILAANCISRAADPPQPRIPDKPFNILDYGAVADGKTLNTQAISKAIAACSSAGGGRVLVPAGRFLTGPFKLASNLDLHLEKDTVLLITDDTSVFDERSHRFENCIIADDCHDLSITGSGTIDGQGQAWWDVFLKAKNSPAGAASTTHRPFMIVLTHCTRVLVSDINLTNSPSFHLVPKECRDVTINAVHFSAPANSPNTDALDPSGWNYLITNCVFDVGDDCIAVKATGAAEDGHLSCEDFLITHCTFKHGHGLSIGGQSNGGLRRMTVRDCAFDSTEAGIRMKAGRGTGGLVEDLTYENLKMTNVKVPIFITSYYPQIPKDPAADPAQPVGQKTPIWRNIRISNLEASDCPSAGRILGLAEMPVQDVLFSNVHISSAKGMEIVHASGIRFVNSSITPASGPAIVAKEADVKGLDVQSGK